MASVIRHHEKSREADTTDSTGHLGLGSSGVPEEFSFHIEPTDNDVSLTPEFDALTRTNLHDKNDIVSQTTATITRTTTSTSSMSQIQHSIRTPRDYFLDDDPTYVGSLEILLHEKHSVENPVSNPKELPEVWVGTSSTSSTIAQIVTTQTPNTAGGSIEEPNTEEVSRVNPAPEYSEVESFGDTFDSSSSSSGSAQLQGGGANGEVGVQASIPAAASVTTDSPIIAESISAPCRISDSGNETTPIKMSSYGSRSSKNPGIVIRYQYELVQDLTGIDWTINAQGERDGTEYLVEQVLPSLEEEMVGEVLVPALFDVCDVKRIRGVRDLMDGNVVGIDKKPDDFPLLQTACISDYTPQDPLLTFQCHRIEGAVTLYFPPNYSYTALLPSITVQTLNAIKEGMENGSLLSSHESVLSLKFLENSYTLSPIVPGESSNSGASTQKSASGGKGGLAAGLVFMFLFLGLLAFFGWRRYTKILDQDDGDFEHEGDVVIDVSDGTEPKESLRNDDEDDNEDASSTSSGSTGEDATTTDEDQDEDGESYSESSDSDGVFEDDDEFDPDDPMSSAYGNMYQKKKKRGCKKAKNNIVIGGVADEGSVATGATGATSATGLHSEASQRTVKMKNIILPNVLDVDLNMR